MGRSITSRVCSSVLPAGSPAAQPASQIRIVAALKDVVGGSQAVLLLLQRRDGQCAAAISTSAACACGSHVLRSFSGRSLAPCFRTFASAAWYSARFSAITWWRRSGVGTRPSRFSRSTIDSIALRVKVRIAHRILQCSLHWLVGEILWRRSIFCERSDQYSASDQMIRRDLMLPCY